ncbi:hypothetical protein IEQ34_019292 [Dendrobium chrysotoxum]|uniref:Uncharacterized protein n=1 Tax=Dendrobium chrysotoxum TaxID=161865 RepID=A0AAV7G892_DENCH|nr:hypothetical protein IEQ34_019292 [Dendrobium chrysotoxum]
MQTTCLAFSLALHTQSLRVQPAFRPAGFKNSNPCSCLLPIRSPVLPVAPTNLTSRPISSHDNLP